MRSKQRGEACRKLLGARHLVADRQKRSQLPDKAADLQPRAGPQRSQVVCLGIALPAASRPHPEQQPERDRPQLPGFLGSLLEKCSGRLQRTAARATAAACRT
mmetsp:Transcript_64969/g.116846  ORF Transcript_64969/g.116846 Transcript_64969/m.116846 type:complete len:103 (+) Transcript_64969:554-862(+)